MPNAEVPDFPTDPDFPGSSTLAMRLPPRTAPLPRCALPPPGPARPILMPPITALARCLSPPFSDPRSASSRHSPCINHCASICSPACRLCCRIAASNCACQQQLSACLLRCQSPARPVISFMCLCNGGPSQCRDQACMRVLCACAMCPPASPCYLELFSRCRGQIFTKVRPTGRLARGRQGGGAMLRANYR